MHYYSVISDIQNVFVCVRERGGRERERGEGERERERERERELDCFGLKIATRSIVFGNGVRS